MRSSTTRRLISAGLLCLLTDRIDPPLMDAGLQSQGHQQHGGGIRQYRCRRRQPTRHPGWQYARRPERNHRRFRLCPADGGRAAHPGRAAIRPGRQVADLASDGFGRARRIWRHLGHHRQRANRRRRRPPRERLQHAPSGQQPGNRRRNPPTRRGESQPGRLLAQSDFVSMHVPSPTRRIT